MILSFKDNKNGGRVGMNVTVRLVKSCHRVKRALMEAA
jgi:hypothetical protein